MFQINIFLSFLFLYKILKKSNFQGDKINIIQISDVVKFLGFHNYLPIIQISALIITGNN